ncbi:MAG: YtxH domain-containing protein [Elusimicrobiota bacterium]
MTNENRGYTGILWFVSGAIAGAALGVLFAPRAGRQTREELANWLKDRRTRGEELMHKVKDGSLIKKDALVAAAKAAKQAYTEANAKHSEAIHS